MPLAVAAAAVAGGLATRDARDFYCSLDKAAWARAMADVVLLWLLVAASAASFLRIRPLAGALLLPTLAWVSFAAALNLSVWLRNPTLL